MVEGPRQRVHAHHALFSWVLGVVDALQYQITAGLLVSISGIPLEICALVSVAYNHKLYSRSHNVTLFLSTGNRLQKVSICLGEVAQVGSGLWNQGVQLPPSGKNSWLLWTMAWLESNSCQDSRQGCAWALWSPISKSLWICLSRTYPGFVSASD
jgi:hypothetical protein